MALVYLVCSRDDEDTREIEGDLKARRIKDAKLTNPEAGAAMLYTPEGAFNSSAAAKMYLYLHGSPRPAPKHHR